LEFIAVSPSEATRDWLTLDGTAVDEGVVSLGGFHTEALSSEELVSLARVSFLVKDVAEENLSLSVIEATDDLAGIPFTHASFAVRSVPREYALEQNYPNPFNPETSIQYSVVSDQSITQHITLKIYNLLGQEVRTLVDEAQAAGYYTVMWDGRDRSGSDVPSGVYFYRLQAGLFSETHRMILLK